MFYRGMEQRGKHIDQTRSKPEPLLTKRDIVLVVFSGLVAACFDHAFEIVQFLVDLAMMISNH